MESSVAAPHVASNERHDIIRKASEDGFKPKSIIRDRRSPVNEVELKREKRANLLFEYMDACAAKEKHDALRTLKELVASKRIRNERMETILAAKRLEDFASIDRKQKDFLRKVYFT
jgi:hypothetical protein